MLSASESVKEAIIGLDLAYQRGAFLKEEVKHLLSVEEGLKAHLKELEPGLKKVEDEQGSNNQSESTEQKENRKSIKSNS